MAPKRQRDTSSSARWKPGTDLAYTVLLVRLSRSACAAGAGRDGLAAASPDQTAVMRTMFAAYWIFILAVLALYFYAGLANR